MDKNINFDNLEDQDPSGYRLNQCSPTPGPRIGPWLNQYRTAQELISYFRFIYYLSLGQ